MLLNGNASVIKFRNVDIMSAHGEWFVASWIFNKVSFESWRREMLNFRWNEWIVVKWCSQPTCCWVCIMEEENFVNIITFTLDGFLFDVCCQMTCTKYWRVTHWTWHKQNMIHRNIASNLVVNVNLDGCLTCENAYCSRASS